MSHSIACLTSLLELVGVCVHEFIPKYPDAFPSSLIFLNCQGCSLWGYPHKRRTGDYQHQLARCLLIPDWHDIWYLFCEFGRWRQAPKSNPPLTYLSATWTGTHSFLETSPPPPCMIRFLIQPKISHIQSKSQMQKKTQNLTYTLRERERHTLTEIHHNFFHSGCRCRPRVPRMRMSPRQRLQAAQTVSLKVSRATRRQRKASPRRVKVCGAIWHRFFRTTKGRGLSVRRWKEQRRRKQDKSGLDENVLHFQRKPPTILGVLPFLDEMISNKSCYGLTFIGGGCTLTTGHPVSYHEMDELLVIWEVNDAYRFFHDF